MLDFPNISALSFIEIICKWLSKYFKIATSIAQTTQFPNFSGAGIDCYFWSKITCKARDVNAPTASHKML